MYETFYGLKEKPFTLLPDPDYLYLSPKHQRALTLLEYGMMNQAGFSVICGDTGAGKTTLIRRLLNELGDDTCVGLITNTHQSFGELLNWVLMAFGLDGDGKSKAQMHQMFISFLIEQYADNKHTVLIVDEAQNMGADTLEELRMLSNINADKDQVLQVILAGQPALRETLRKPELMQFAQRIAVDYYLESLSIEETQNYIYHRLNVAGTEETIFTSSACKAIYKYSGGTPRLINLLCDTALVYGYAEQSEYIDEQLVHDVVREQHSNSIIPTFNTEKANNSVASTESSLNEVVDAPIAQSQNGKEAENSTTEESNSEPIKAKPAEKSGVEKLTGLENAVNMSAEVEKVVIPAAQIDAEPVKEVESAAAVEEMKPESESEFDDLELEELESKNPEDKKLASEDEDSVVEEAAEESEPLASSAALSSQSSQQGTAEAVIPVNSEAYENDAPNGQYHNQDIDDVYPIVHIEENPRKGFNVILVGVVAGMFVASIVMMVAAWVMFGDGNMNDERDIQENFAQQKEAEKRELKVLQKERDAALAVSRALEMERDAAIISAKAKEQMRAAEMRAAEILAEQQRKAAKKLEQANARARAAKQAEAKALEREREMLRQARAREIELKAQRESFLRKEKWRLERIAQEEKMKAQRKKQLAVVQKPVVQSRIEEKPVEVKKVKSSESFSTNPCNSPSAKFLSTCKK